MCKSETQPNNGIACTAFQVLRADCEVKSNVALTVTCSDLALTLPSQR